MVTIVADNPTIENEIRNLLGILTDAGSGFHSNLLIHEEGGGLSVKTQEPMDGGKEIIRLPRTVLMPGDQYSLDIIGDEFVVEYLDNAIVSDVQRRVIDKMYEIYNLTNKVKLHKEFSFLLSLKNVPSLIDKLAEGRDFVVGPYVGWVELIKAEMNEDQLLKVVCETYVKTRPLGYSDPVRESSVSMIMPVLDFMNHHWSGGSFSVGQGGRRKGDLTMQSSQPFENSTECFANYGIMDAFDTLVRYDFIDESAPIVRSVPVDIDGPAGDKIQIKNEMSFVFKKELSKEMQDLRRHIPEIKFEGDQMIVSHVFIPVEKSEFALVRILNFILASYNEHHSKALNENEVKAWRVKAQEVILEKNREYYNELLGVIAALPEDQKESFGVARVRDLANHQMKNIENYKISE